MRFRLKFVFFSSSLHFAADSHSHTLFDKLSWFLSMNRLSRNVFLRFFFFLLSLLCFRQICFSSFPVSIVFSSQASSLLRTSTLSNSTSTVCSSVCSSWAGFLPFLSLCFFTLIIAFFVPLFVWCVRLIEEGKFDDCEQYFLTFSSLSVDAVSLVLELRKQRFFELLQKQEQQTDVAARSKLAQDSADCLKYDLEPLLIGSVISSVQSFGSSSSSPSSSSSSSSDFSSVSARRQLHQTLSSLLHSFSTAKHQLPLLALPIPPQVRCCRTRKRTGTTGRSAGGGKEKGTRRER